MVQKNHPWGVILVAIFLPPVVIFGKKSAECFVGAGVGGQQESTNARSPAKTTKNFILECLQKYGWLSKNTGGMCSDRQKRYNQPLNFG